jgi:hypothetical protein
VIQQLSPLMRVFKSPDGSTWDEQDAGNSFSPFTESPYSSWLHSDGFDYVFYNIGDFYNYAIRRFDTATDTWETSDFTGGLVSVNVSDQASVRIVVCADGDVVCFFQDVNTGYPTVIRYDGVSWGAEIPILAVNGFPIDAIVDGSDRVLLAWSDATNNAQSYITFDQTDTFGRLQDFDSEVHATPTLSSHMCRFNDGANDMVAILARDLPGGELDVHYGIEGSTLGSLTTVEAVSTDTIVGRLSIGLAVLNGQVYAGWSARPGGSDSFLHYAVSTSLSPLTFGPDTTLLTVNDTGDAAPQWIVGLNAIGLLYKQIQDEENIFVEWLIQPASYNPWPAWDTSQQTIFTRE